MARPSLLRVSDRTPYFFKVFFPRLSSEHLMIPPKFRKHIEAERSPVTVSLKGPGGRIWHVGLAKRSDGFFFENGWGEFVADHSLEFGDLLVFRYDGRCRFTVLLFDGSACEKEGAFSVGPCNECIAVLDMSAGGEESVGEEPSRALVAPTVQAMPKRKRGISDGLMLEGSLRKEHSSSTKVASEELEARSTHSHQAIVRKSMPTRDIGSFISLDEKQMGMTSSPSNSSKVHRGTQKEKSRIASSISLCTTMDKKPISSDRYRKILSKSKLHSRSGRVVEASPSSRTSKSSKSPSSEKPNKISKTSGSIRPCTMPSKCLPLIKSSEMPRLGEVVVKKQRQGGLTSQRRPVTDDELYKTLKMAKSFKSKNPFFIVEMQDSHVYYGFYMNIPQTFAGEHFPKKSSKITLWDSNRNKWSVSYVSYWRRGIFSAGWSKFSYTNNLEKGDVCVFELIKKYNMRVHIFRVVEELTPLIKSPPKG